MLSAGRLLVASSLLNSMDVDPDAVVFSTKVITFRPAASSAVTKLVTSTSYHCAVVPATAALASTAAALAGLMFHVSEVSAQLVLLAL